MRIYQVAMLLIPMVASAAGCQTVAEILLDSLDHSDEIEPAILKRKGIEPGSKRHKRLLAEEEMQREMDSRRAGKWTSN